MNQGQPEVLRTDEVTVIIHADPGDIWRFVADLTNWPQFSEFGANMEHVGDNEWIARTSQGDIRVITHFDEEKLQLDTMCILPSSEEQYIPYGIVDTEEGAKVTMVNQRTSSVGEEDYEEQLRWARNELQKLKELMER